jgi:hypothetical protein
MSYHTVVPAALRWAGHARSLKDPINLRGKHKIAFGQAVDLMGIDGDFRFTPGKQNVRMMALLFGDRSRAIDKIQSLLKIGKPEYLMQMVLFDDLPIRNFRIQFCKSLAFERGHASLARYARLICQ